MFQDSPPQFQFTRQIEWGADLYKKRQIRQASRFVVLMEDPLDQSLAFRMETMGYHRKWAEHNVMMLDGHAELIRARLSALDQLPFPRGANWTAHDESPSAPGPPSRRK